jgi:hypothetical protein
VLDLGQPAAQIRILRSQVGDPLLKRGDEGQECGLGLGWDRVPEWWGGSAVEQLYPLLRNFCTESSALR